MEWKHMLFGEFYDDTGNNDAPSTSPEKNPNKINNSQNGSTGFLTKYLMWFVISRVLKRYDAWVEIINSTKDRDSF